MDDPQWIVVLGYILQHPRHILERFRKLEWTTSSDRKKSTPDMMTTTKYSFLGERRSYGM